MSNLYQVPNRIKILREFDFLLEKYKYKSKNTHEFNIKLSDDKLYSKLQKIIFEKINNIHDHETLKNIIMKDNNSILNNNIYIVANDWCIKKYLS